MISLGSGPEKKQKNKPLRRVYESTIKVYSEFNSSIF